MRRNKKLKLLEDLFFFFCKVYLSVNLTVLKWLYKHTNASSCFDFWYIFTPPIFCRQILFNSSFIKWSVVEYFV